MTTQAAPIPRAHSILPASGMYRWKACPGSVRLCRDIPEQTNKYADEGTFAHDKAARFVKSDLPPDEYWKLPEEMQKAIKLYSDTIADDFALDPNAQLFIEHKFDLSSVYPGCYGTADAVLWSPKKRILRVYDFKYGAGHVIHPENNEQLLYYGLGAVVTLKFGALVIELIIVQPRAHHKRGPVRRWAVPAIELMDFEMELVEAARKTAAPNAPLVPGRHCWFCPAKIVDQCPAVFKERQEQAASEFDEIDDIMS